MNNYLNIFRPTLVFIVILTIILGFIYPAVSTVILQSVFPDKASGSLIKDKNGNILGSELIGQNFSDPKYLWGRVSATGHFPYNAAASSGSNYSNTNPAFLDSVKARIETLEKYDPDNKRPIPVDLVTASGSGLDPHISIAAANYQVARIAQQRGKSQQEIKSIIQKYTEGRQFGILGEPRVNVLMVNLALDGKL